MWALVNADDNSIVEVISNAKTITINEVKFLHYGLNQNLIQLGYTLL